MRLLLRANAHRVAGPYCREVAASPDTDRPEPWRWHVRLHTGGRDDEDPPSPGTGRRVLRLTDGAALEAVTDPSAVTAEVHVLGDGDNGSDRHGGGEQLVERGPGDVVVLLAWGGTVVVEERHTLAEGDALVLAGDDDPLAVGVRREETADCAVVRLGPADGGALGWVP